MSKIAFLGSITWIKDNYENERGEFERAAIEVSGPTNKIKQTTTRTAPSAPTINPYELNFPSPEHKPLMM